MNKFLPILKSVRFQQVLIGALLEMLLIFGIIDASIANPETIEAVVRVLQTVLGISVIAGTADSVATKASTTIVKTAEVVNAENVENVAVAEPTEMEALVGQLPADLQAELVTLLKNK